MRFENKISVLFLSCRRLPYLRKTLSSVRNYFKAVENSLTPILICFDNGSSREEQEALRSMGFDTLLLSDRNLGIGPAMNRLMDAVETEWILNLQDDWVVDNPFSIPFVSESIAIMESDPRIATVKLDAMHFLDFSDRHRYSAGFRSPSGRSTFFVQNPKLLWGGFSFPPSICRTSSLREVGRFSEDRPNQRGWAESEYSHRFSQRFFAAKSPEMLIFEHIGDEPCHGWNGSNREKTANVNGPHISDPTKRLATWGSQCIAPREDSGEVWKIEKKKLRERSPKSCDGLLFVGPWIGEFGWEICRWQGGVRRLVKEWYQDHYIIVSGDRGNHPLYEFADEYWTVPRVLTDSNLLRESYRRLPKHLAYPLLNTVRNHLSLELENFDQPTRVLEPRHFELAEQEFVCPRPSKEAAQFRDTALAKAGYNKWVCLFPRQRDLNPQKNWSKENWNCLIQELRSRFGACSVILGRREDTMELTSHDGSVISLLDCTAENQLDTAIAFLNGATAAIGSECGGPFLSMLCGIPTLVMGGRHYRERYEKTENPMNTQCKYLEAEGYVHPIEDVLPEVSEFLETVNRESPPDRRKSEQSSTTERDHIQSLEPRPKEKSFVGQLPMDSARKSLKCIFAGVFDERSTNVSQAEALGRAGCNVHRYPYRERSQLRGLRFMNDELVSACDAIRPSFLLLSKCNGVSSDTISRCQAFCPVILWYMDGLNNLDRELLSKIEVANLSFFSRRGPLLKAQECNAGVRFLPEGFDPVRDTMVEAPSDYDISFIGELRGSRKEYWEVLRFEVIQNAYGTDHPVAVSKSRINLNFTDNRDGTSDRAYKILAGGGFLLTEPWLGIDQDFDIGLDLVTFENLNDLKRKAVYFLEHPMERMRIAESGYRSVQRYSRDRWAQEILGAVKQLVPPPFRQEMGPVPIGRDCPDAEFRNLEVEGKEARQRSDRE